MKKLFGLAFLILMGLILLNRQRVFVRDPLASVYRSAAADGADAVKQTGVQVYINYSNDILMLKETQPGAYNLLLQHWNQVPGTPVNLKCIHWMACLTDADQASLLPAQMTEYDPKVQMTDRDVTFIDLQGGSVRVQLR